MIITRQKSQDEILKGLAPHEKIFILGCGDCAAVCKTGGAPEVQSMADFLAGRGKQITGTAVADTACVAAQIRIVSARNKAALSVSDAVLVLACGGGVQALVSYGRLEAAAIPGCETLYQGMIDKEGSFLEVCSSCGACILDETAGICPVTRCSKGLLNGPCGGQKDGRCETDPQKDCAWVLIYRALKARNTTAGVSQYRPPRSHKKDGSKFKAGF